MWDKYYSVSTIEEALQLLNEHGNSARIIAGGTDILIELERGLRPNIHTLIDISRIPELDEIVIDADWITLGAMVTHNQVIADTRLRDTAWPLVQACWEVGAPQIRNRATVAGNLITASPANDTISPLIALGAEVQLRSLNQERWVALADFYTGLRQTVMQTGEILTSIRFRPLADSQRGVFLKLGLRRAQAISVINTAIVLGFDGNIINHARITLGSVAPTIIRAEEAENKLIGRALDEATIHQIAPLAARAATPIGDIRATADYRSEMLKVLIARGLRDLIKQTEWTINPPYLWDTNESQTATGLTATSEHSGNQVIETNINGQPYTLPQGFNKTLLRLLREDAGLSGTKEGCAEGECGACTVFLDGAAVMACMVPAPRAHHAEITTIEGIGTPENLHPLQQAFVDHGAVQCGYCTPGFIMSGVKLLEEIEDPTKDQILYSMSGNLCRCTGYYKIVEAVQSAAQNRQERT